jgi:protein gp37
VAKTEEAGLMGGKSNIEWTEHTWNPIVGCSIVSPGCTNCYAMKMAGRLSVIGHSQHYKGTTKRVNGNTVWTGKLALAPETTLLEPLRRKKPAMYFVNSMGDLFHEDCPDEWIDRVFAVMALAPQHTFQVLTKRAERMREYFAASTNIPGFSSAAHYRVACGVALRGGASDDMRWPLPNVWLGVSTEDQKRADERIPLLLQTPAAVRFISAEPLLGPVDLTRLAREGENGAFIDDALTGFRSNGHGGATGPKLDWVIVGGESGGGARPMHPEWARSLRDQCAQAETAFFFKQWGEHAHATQCDLQISDAWTEVWVDENTVVARIGKAKSGRLLDGKIYSEFPKQEVQT